MREGACVKDGMEILYGLLHGGCYFRLGKIRTRQVTSHDSHLQF